MKSLRTDVGYEEESCNGKLDVRSRKVNFCLYLITKIMIPFQRNKI